VGRRSFSPRRQRFPRPEVEGKLSARPTGRTGDREDPPGASGIARWLLLILIVPILGEFLLVAFGLARAEAVVCLIVAEIFAALALALVWREDLERLRRVAESLPTRPPRLPEIDRIAATLAHAIETGRAEQARLAGSLRMEEAMTERLPEPLILVSADGTVQRANEAARHSLGAVHGRAAGCRSLFRGARPAGAPRDGDADGCGPVPGPQGLHPAGRPHAGTRGGADAGGFRRQCEP
jgi:PAS domain-containing protein